MPVFEEEDFYVFPASYAQRRMWFLEEYSLGEAVYHVGFALHIQGDLQPSLLQKSLQALVERHEVLRTVFAMTEEDELAQVIFPSMRYPLPLENAVGATLEDMTRLCGELLKQPFPLTQPPLFRPRLFELGEERYVLFLAMHHIVADGWSLGLLLRDLFEFYESFSRNRVPKLPALTIQYADFAEWEHERLQGEHLASLQDYWKETLTPLPDSIALPTRLPTPATPDFEGAHHYEPLDAECVRQFRSLLREEEASLFMGFLALLKILLYRTSGARDLVVGTLSAGREQPELEPLVGFFSNTLALRTLLEPELSFRENLQRVKASTLGAFSHQELPFEQLFPLLGMSRKEPLFRVLYIHQNTPPAPLKTEGWEFEQLSIGASAARADLVLTLPESDGEIWAECEYRTSLFSENQIRSMMAGFSRLLQAVVAAPETPISRLPFLSQESRQRLLEDWQGKAESLPSPSMWENFLLQVQQHPHKPALQCGSKAWSYRELREEIERRAKVLCNHGVTMSSLVLLSELSREQGLLTLLSLWRLGALWLVIPEEWPDVQKEELLSTLSPACVVVGHSVPLSSEIPTLCLSALLTSESSESKLPHLAEESEGFACYATSGTTGTPRVIELGVGAVHSFVQHATELYEIRESDRVLQFASLHFDASLEEIFPTLLSGAVLVSRENDWLPTPAEFAAFVRQQQITVLDLPTAFWHVLMGAETALDFGSQLRLCILGGEEVQLSSWQRWVETQPSSTRLLNTYGPTEATVVATWDELRPEDLEESRRRGVVSIGRPFPDMEAHVLSHSNSLLPVGAVGELILAGKGLARGLRGSSEAMLEPHFRTPGMMQYRTGDLVRRREDGRLEWMGRKDNQLKIRGHRIELEGIARLLEQHDEVRQARVLRSKEGQETNLTAFLQLRESSSFLSEIRDELASFLTPAQQPQRWVCVDDWPLTSRGKVDHQKLLMLETNITKPAVQTPKSPLEESIAQLWKTLLPVTEVGREDNFFSLGGHSLLAIQLISQLRKWFEVPFSLKSLFEVPTIAGIAAEIERLKGRGLSLQPILPRAGKYQTLAPTSYGQRRLWFLSRLEPHSPRYHLPGALRLQGELDKEALKASLQALMTRHEILRTSFVTVNNEPWQQIHDSLPLPLVWADVSGTSSPEEEALSRLRLESLRLFDLSCPPLFRLIVYRLSEQEHLLFVCFHHSLVDGWSIGAFWKDFWDGYNCSQRKQPLFETPLPLQYADYACWQREQLEGPSFQVSRDYWLERLEGIPTSIQWLTARQRTGLQTSMGRSTRFWIPGQLRDRLQEESQRRGATLFMGFLAAFSVFLHKCSNQTDLVVGTPVTQQERSEFEGVIGFFTNSLALRCSFEKHWSFRELLGEIRKHSLEDYTHQEFPFEKLVEELNPPRSLSHHPLFQTMLVFLNTPWEQTDRPALDVSGVVLENQTTALDLTLYLSEQPEGVLGIFETNQDLFAPSTVQQMVEHFLLILEELLTHPTRALSEVSLLGEEEAKQLLLQGQGEQVALAPTTTLEVIEKQMEVCSEQNVLLYDGMDLNGYIFWWRVKLIASELQERGVQAGDRVGVWLERNFDLPVALLGIWACGAAYVPLTSDWPAYRRKEIAEDARLKALLCSESLHPRALEEGLGAVQPCWKLNLNQWTTDWNNRDFPPLVYPAPDSLCYLLYTSGSTGKPKGVQLSHRALLNHLQWLQKEIPLTGDDRVLHKTSPTFDVSVWELFWPFFAGATLVFTREGDEREPARMLHWIDLYDVTTLHLVPSMLSSFQDAWGEDEGASLRRILAIGESLSTDVVKNMAYHPECQLYNLYGPTEAAVAVTLHACNPTERPEFVPLGHVGDNTSLAVVSEKQTLVPCGFPGELWLAGDCLANGYWDREEWTQRSFPFVDLGTGMQRWYRTGDLVRWSQEGELEFLGRTDQQVKLRGYRLELGEIEARLQSHPAVSQVAVVVVETSTGQQLSAYIEWSRDEEWREIRESLREQLPPIMVPTLWQSVKEWPRLPSGKLDRKQLATWSNLLPKTATGQISPESPLEVELLLRWEKVLQKRPLGVENSFFEEGGHSLLVLQLLKELEAFLGRRIPVASIFETPTVRGFAESIQRSGWMETWPSLVPLQKQGTKPPLFLIHGMDGGVFYYHNLATALGEDQPVYGLQAKGMDGKELPLLSVEEMVERYIGEIRSVQPHGPYQLGGYCFGAEVALKMANQLREEGEELSLFVVIDKALVRPELFLEPQHPYEVVEVNGIREWKYTEEAFAILHEKLGSFWLDDTFAEEEKQRIHEVWEQQKFNIGFEWSETVMSILLMKMERTLVLPFLRRLVPYLPADIEVPGILQKSGEVDDEPVLMSWLWEQFRTFLDTIEPVEAGQPSARALYLRLLEWYPFLHSTYQPVDYEGSLRGHQGAHRIADSNIRLSNLQRYYDGDMVLIQTRESTSHTDDATLGWSQSCSGTIHLTVLPCNHDELFREPYVNTMAEALEPFLSDDSGLLSDT